ncbi:MAG: pyridoxine 5'-phosphate synthase [Nitrospinota bacterium]|nr:pyridoxine 5'-phosphate synthase [Nitrospinota bacterium]
MAKLGVNVDHVATLRQARLIDYPDPVAAAKIAIEHDVSCITVHLREDRRHIQDRDVYRIRELENCRLNLEMAASEEIIKIALDVKPDQVTLVPERRAELTTEGGLDVLSRIDFYRELVARFRDAGIPVSLFIDTDDKQVEASSRTEAGAVEINTGKYSEADSKSKQAERLNDVRRAVESAHALGMVVHAGHGLHYENVSPVAALPWVDELNIGHSIVSQAVFVGFSKAVLSMKELIEKASAGAKGV